MLLSESYKKRLLELAGINQDVIDTIKNGLFQQTDPKIINKYLEEHPSWFTAQEKLALQIQSGQIEKHNGNLTLSHISIKSLGSLKSVNGYLFLNRTPLQSLGELEDVKSNLVLDNALIKSLGNLTNVGGYLDLAHTPIKSLSKLKTVSGIIISDDTPNLSWDKIPKHLWNKVKGKGNPPQEQIQEAKEESAKKTEVINSLKKTLFKQTDPKIINKYLEKHPSWFTEEDKLALQIQSGQIEEYDGDLNFRFSLIISLGNLKRVTGFLILDKAKQIKSLGKLEYVGTYLYLDSTQIETLGNVKFIGDNFTAFYTPLKDFGKIKVIQGHIGLTDTPNLSWENIPKHLWNKIKGKGNPPQEQIQEAKEGSAKQKLKEVYGSAKQIQEAKEESAKQIQEAKEESAKQKLKEVYGSAKQIQEAKEESAKQKLKEVYGSAQDKEKQVNKTKLINSLKKTLFKQTNPKLINKYLEKHPGWFSEKEIIALQIQSGQIEKYDGDLNLTNIPIQSLGNLKNVSGF